MTNVKKLQMISNSQVHHCVMVPIPSFDDTINSNVKSESNMHANHACKMEKSFDLYCLFGGCAPALSFGDFDSYC
eukprot:SAG31_NODE_9765_length_1230_cov_1.707339_1_plen_74_part_10